MTAEPWVCEPVRPITALSAPQLVVPAEACDAHMHVFGDLKRYPPIQDARYDWPDADLSHYLRVKSRLGLSRMVLVQPSFYGHDNSCLFDAMAEVGADCRGVVFAPTRPDATELDDLAARGVTGLRLDLFRMRDAGLPLAEMEAQLRAAARIAARMSWHVELYSPGQVTWNLLDVLATLPAPVSVNHFGYMTEAEGLTDEHFAGFVRLVANADCWVKLTAPYRLKPESEARALWMARELIAAAPDRIVWGTDWPHIPTGGLDTGALLNRLANWCPDEARQRAILVDNPARLYQFD